MRDSLDPQLREKIATALEQEGIKATSAVYPSIAYETLLKLRLELGISPKRTGPPAVAAESLIEQLTPEQITGVKSATSLRQAMRATGLGATSAKRVFIHLAGKATAGRITPEQLMQRHGFGRDALVCHFRLHTNRHLSDEFKLDLSVVVRLRTELGLPAAKVGRPFASAASATIPKEDLAARIEAAIRERGLTSAMRKLKRAGVDRGQVTRVYLERIQPSNGTTPADSLAAMSSEQVAILADLTILRHDAAAALGLSRDIVSGLRNYLGAHGVTRDYVRLYSDQLGIGSDSLRFMLDCRSLGEAAALLGCGHATVRKLRVQLGLSEQPDRIRTRFLKRMEEICTESRIAGIQEFGARYGSLTDTELRDKFGLSNSCITALRVELSSTQAEPVIAA